MAGQIVLKSQNAIDNLADLPDINYYINRVKADGGVIYNMNALLDVFAFIYSKNITDSEVFSAINPAWGVKYDPATGNISKLYSLFDPAGDLKAFGGSLPIKLQNDLGVPSAYLGGSQNTYLKAAGTVSGVETIGYATAAVIPQLSNYGAGAGTNFPLGLLWSREAHDAADPVGSVTPYVAASWYVGRPDTSNITLSQWTEYFSVFSSTGSAGSNALTGYENAKPLSAFADTGGLRVYKNGLQVLFDSTVTQTPIHKDKLELLIGATVTGTGAPATTYFLGHFIENWVLVNTASEKMIEISKRINDKYYAVIPH
ncbi:hypothetical protein [Acinetobacter baumannii]|uniref:hypothetical protein n=1 Tax=Acinetobacter baumannii TaxID=470 RepID=UPI0011234C14|nr:hypothetical protein [Acinetobacter baumannii]MBU0426226.1 hypothetical protein [Acinetobacter baumannii]TNW59477.1 hypothetical protein EPJ58_08510 [Acinetobacter baumannii]UMM91622.1 hypothetical protein L2Z37_01950 [Acinetobacter baumannii]